VATDQEISLEESRGKFDTQVKKKKKKKKKIFDSSIGDARSLPR
jgi:hypothetical protein